jgi:hypothetical protein
MDIFRQVSYALLLGVPTDYCPRALVGESVIIKTQLEKK